MMDPAYGWGFGFGFMWIFPVIFLVIFIFFMRGIFGFGGSSNSQNITPRSESAREILDKRFARGEINKEEYEEMKRSLGDKS